MHPTVDLSFIPRCAVYCADCLELRQNHEGGKTRDVCIHASDGSEVANVEESACASSSNREHPEL